MIREIDKNEYKADTLGEFAERLGIAVSTQQNYCSQEHDLVRVSANFSFLPSSTEEIYARFYLGFIAYMHPFQHNLKKQDLELTIFEEALCFEKNDPDLRDTSSYIASRLERLSYLILEKYPDFQGNLQTDFSEKTMVLSLCDNLPKRNYSIETKAA